MSFKTNDTITDEISIGRTQFADEMQTAYLDYALSVIISRALPDARDGLKPVQRRILYAMRKAGYDWSKPYKKSAGTVGDTMKNYHPHGNAPIYDALVRMAQPFSLRLPLIDGQGNFGSLDGDPPAAERYTEARLAVAAKFLLHEQDMESVPYELSYDNSNTICSVLPARFPNLLVNGASGIAVGMATNIPPHNLNETLEACKALLDNPSLTINELMEYIPGPDFPLGGELLKSKGLIDAYHTGRGSVTLRGTYRIEESDSKSRIIIDTLPYQVNKARFMENIAQLIKDGDIEEIADLRDESNEEGIRILIETKRNVNEQVLVNKLLNKTQLQISIHFNMLAVLNQQPMQLNLKQMLEIFINFREQVIIERTLRSLSDARQQAHKLWGLALAIGDIDKVIECIKKSADPEDAERALQELTWDMSSAAPFLKLLSEHYDVNQKTYHFSQEQAKAILDLRLHRLTRLEFDKLSGDVQKLADNIAGYLNILNNKQIRIDLMKAEFDEVKKSVGTKRLTVISNKNALLNDEDLIENDLMVVTLSLSGYIKRMDIDLYRTQRRGGKGKSSANLHSDDIAMLVITGTNHSSLLLFSNIGKVYSLKIYQVPENSSNSIGKAIMNLLPIDYENNERINNITLIPSDIEKDDKSIVFVTESGKVRRNNLDAFEKIPSNGKRAVSEDEILVNCMLMEKEEDLLLSTSNGKAIRFSLDELRVMQSRDSAGVIGIELKNNDKVVSALKIGANGGMILTISVKGYGKRTDASEYRCAHRGGQGVSTMDVTKKTGSVLKVLLVQNDDELILLTKNGQLIRCPVAGIRICGRDTQGVMLVNLDKDDELVNATLVADEADDEVLETKE